MREARILGYHPAILSDVVTLYIDPDIRVTVRFGETRWHAARYGVRYKERPPPAAYYRPRALKRAIEEAKPP